MHRTSQTSAGLGAFRSLQFTGRRFSSKARIAVGLKAKRMTKPGCRARTKNLSAPPHRRTLRSYFHVRRPGRVPAMEVGVGT